MEGAPLCVVLEPQREHPEVATRSSTADANWDGVVGEEVRDRLSVPRAGELDSVVLGGLPRLACHRLFTDGGGKKASVSVVSGPNDRRPLALAPTEKAR